MGESCNVLFEAVLTGDQGNIVQSVCCFMASFVAGQKKRVRGIYVAGLSRFLRL